MISRVNVLGTKLDIDKLKNDGLKLKSVSKQKVTYIFTRGEVFQELFTTFENGTIHDIEFRFNKEAYGDADLTDDSSIQDAINGILPANTTFFKELDSNSEWIESCKLYFGPNGLVTVNFFTGNDEWIIIDACLNISEYGMTTGK